MYHYTIIQWLFFFYFYCFCGWCVESTYVSIKSKKLTNRGFMRGPFLPIYGSGATMMLVVSMPFQGNIFLTYVAGCIGATVLEYVTGVTMEALFKVRYWDYSKNKFNFQGHICLGSSLSWGLLTIVMTEWVHVPVEKLVLSIPGQALTVVTLALTAGIFADFALSFKAAIDLRNVLMKMKQVKEEMMRIQRRLDAIIAMANESFVNYKEAFAESMNMAKEERIAKKDAKAEKSAARKEEFAQSMSELKSGIEGKLESIKTAFQTKPTANMESVKDELLELKTRYTVNMEDHKRLSGLKDFFQRDMIRSNPGMTSVKFQEPLEELKERASEKKEKTSGKKEKVSEEKERASEKKERASEKKEKASGKREKASEKEKKVSEKEEKVSEEK